MNEGKKDKSTQSNNTGISGSYFYSGGVNVNGGEVTIQNSTISNNTTDSLFAGGGGIYATGYSGNLKLDVINTTISNNSSAVRGAESATLPSTTLQQSI